MERSRKGATSLDLLLSHHTMNEIPLPVFVTITTTSANGTINSIEFYINDSQQAVQDAVNKLAQQISMTFPQTNKSLMYKSNPNIITSHNILSHNIANKRKKPKLSFISLIIDPFSSLFSINGHQSPLAQSMLSSNSLFKHDSINHKFILPPSRFKAKRISPSQMTCIALPKKICSKVYLTSA